MQVTLAVALRTTAPLVPDTVHDTVVPPALAPEQLPAALPATEYVVPLVELPSKLPPVSNGLSNTSVQTLAAFRRCTPATVRPRSCAASKEYPE